ncbi:MAG TPA: 3-phosphoshikimate 1-carboxyvinyltransferase [Pyrinomonadaceae bacterium]|nr:3-phosphoshikimate 1-carboxyvinyltransferase [Pyrinomonadaceae bacterium]
MRITPARRLKGRLTLPGDKSISHRAALIAALSSGNSEISNFSTARDCASTLACLQQLGISIHRTDDGRIRFPGNQPLTPPRERLDCGNSGSTMRILAGILAGQNFSSELIGDESLSARPMRRIIEPLEIMGAKIESTEGKPPLKIHGTDKLVSITYELPVASAQVKSAILFAGLSTHGRTTVIEKMPTRDHTERLFNGFGVPVTIHESSIYIDGPARFTGGSITIPGDASSAAYFVAAAMLLPRSELTIENVGLNPTRAAFLNVFKTWGAEISTTDLRDEHNEPVGTINVRGWADGVIGRSAEGEIDSGSPNPPVSGSMIPSLIDELPLLAVTGTQIPGGIQIRDAEELRLKESDRLQATAQNLRAMGAEVEEFDDGIAVAGPTQLRGAKIDSYGDHRIAMAFSIAALIADGETEIKGSECVAISFPEFFELLHSLAER